MFFVTEKIKNSIKLQLKIDVIEKNMIFIKYNWFWSN